MNEPTFPSQETAPKNIHYWEEVLGAPTPEYQAFFEAEHAFLIEKIRPGSKVLDIGCGEGRNMRSIFSVTEDVHGIDNDPTAVEHARENFKEASFVTITLADAVDLPFEDKTFDTVTHLMALSNLDARKADSLQECVRVLKDEGFVILSSFSDTAFEERMKIYKQVGVPIKRIEGTKVIFDESVGAHTSEQFSQDDIEKLAHASGLQVIEYIRVGQLCFLAILKKG